MVILSPPTPLMETEWKCPASNMPLFDEFSYSQAKKIVQKVNVPANESNKKWLNKSERILWWKKRSFTT